MPICICFIFKRPVAVELSQSQNVCPLVECRTANSTVFAAYWGRKHCVEGKRINFRTSLGNLDNGYLLMWCLWWQIFTVTWLAIVKHFKISLEKGYDASIKINELSLCNLYMIDSCMDISSNRQTKVCARFWILKYDESITTTIKHV